MEDFTVIANSLPMWIAAALPVSLVIFQAIIFARKSYSSGLKMGLTEVQMKDAMKSSFITSIGPSIVILTGLLALLITIGAPMAWMRLSFIGSVMFESLAAGFGMEAVGVKLGTDPITSIAYANAIWTMTLGSLGWILVSVLTADKMDKVQTKVSKGNPNTMKIISAGALLGSFGAIVAGNLMSVNAEGVVKLFAGKNTIAVFAGAGIMLALSLLADKKDIKWLKEWALAFALFGGMIITALV